MKIIETKQPIKPVGLQDQFDQSSFSISTLKHPTVSSTPEATWSSHWALIVALLRELTTTTHFPREIEPNLVMSDEAEVSAYRRAGGTEGSMSGAYVYQTGRITQAIAGCQTVIDLGCGPANQLAQVAAMNPQTHFIGVELSDEMLQQARAHVKEIGLTNVTFIKQDMTRLEAFATHSVDGVISTVALHHLPSLEHLKRTLQEVNRVLKPGGALYLTDFGRLKSKRTVQYFTYKNADVQPNLFTQDYESSLLAAFLLSDFEKLTRECLPQNVRVRSTFLMPFFLAVKTADRTVPHETVERLHRLAKDLPARYKVDFDQMRLFYRCGGFGPDLFGKITKDVRNPEKFSTRSGNFRSLLGRVWPRSNREISAKAVVSMKGATLKKQAIENPIPIEPETTHHLLDNFFTGDRTLSAHNSPPNDSLAVCEPPLATRLTEMAIVYKRIIGLSDRGQGHSMTQWPADPPADFALTSDDGRRLAPWE